MAKIKNIAIFLGIGTVLVLVYVFFIKKSPDTANLVSNYPTIPVNTVSTDGTPSVANDFITLLLSVKNIKLNDTIFSDKAFISLHDSSIMLVPDGNEGRPNPFAPLGSENTVVASTTGIPVTN